MHLRRGSRECRLAPRGAAKSTWSTQAYPLYVALHGLEPYTILSSDTGSQAGKYVDAIREELESNAIVAERYGGALRGLVARQGYLKLGNGCVIEAASTGSKIRGRKNGPHRPTLIVVDDPQSIDHIISELMRERSWQWLQQDVMNAGTPETNIVVLGTALHRDCIVCRLQSTPGWRTLAYRSIITWPSDMSLWNHWRGLLFDYDNPTREQAARAFYEANREAMHA